MKIFMLTESIFSIILSLLYILYLLFSKQNRIIEIIITVIIIIVGLSALFILSMIQGQYHLNEKFVDWSYVVALAIIIATGFLSEFLIKKFTHN